MHRWTDGCLFHRGGGEALTACPPDPPFSRSVQGPHEMELPLKVAASTTAAPAPVQASQLSVLMHKAVSAPPGSLEAARTPLWRELVRDESWGVQRDCAGERKGLLWGVVAGLLQVGRDPLEQLVAHWQATLVAEGGNGLGCPGGLGIGLSLRT